MKKLNLYKPPYVLLANLISKDEKSKNIGRFHKLDRDDFQVDYIRICHSFYQSQ